MVQYRCIKLRDPFNRGSYGIVGQEYSEDGVLVQRIVVEDISCNPTFVSHLAETCTAGQLSLLHLEDIIADARRERNFLPASDLSPSHEAILW